MIEDPLAALDLSPATPAGAPRRRRSLTTTRQRVVAAGLILAALGFLVWKGLSSALDYYLTANQAVAQRAQLGDSDFRIQGTVVPGVRQVGADLRFAIASHNVVVQVDSSGSPPQLFQAGVPVVLEGHWQGRIFTSSQIMVQHSSSYVEASSTKAKTKASKTGASAKVASRGARGEAG